MKRKVIDFTKGPIAPSLLSFAIPLFFTNILQQAYSITDSIIVGQLLGPMAIAAIGATQTFTNLSISFAIGITLGLSVTLSQFFGAHDEESMRKTVSTGYIFFSIIAIIISILGIIFTPAVLRATGCPDEIKGDSTAYLRIIFLGTFFQILYNTTSSMFRGVGNSRMPLYFLAISSVINIFLDIFFIRIGLGVAGTALATILSQVISSIVAFAVFQNLYPEASLRIREAVFDLKIVKKFLAIGVPSGFKGTAYWLGFVFITAVVNGFGPITIAAFSVAGKIDAFIQTPMISLQNGLSSFVGQNAGARKPERIKQGVHISMGFGILFSLIMTGIVWIFSPFIMHMFTPDEAVIAIGVQYLRITSIFYIIYALQEVVQGVAVGTGNTLILLLSTLVAMWVCRVPLVYHAAAAYGLEGIWWSLPSGWFIAAIFANGYYLSGKWKKRIMKNNSTNK